MAKIKLTKNELKQQRDALKRFERYLPTLQLKKQQLQLEIRQVREQLSDVQEALAGFTAEIDRWVALLTPEDARIIRGLVVVDEWVVSIRNIAGIDTPRFEYLTFGDVPRNLFTTPLWYDDACAAVEKLIEYELRQRILREQLDLIEQELRVVTQRVNLFEKVKIPEARDNIRRIQIYLGDQQTNAVGRAKIAKEKCRIRDEETALAG